ncbi:MAG: hypothetical protein ABSD76_21385, partial [Terriglobales bacterium]
MGVVNQAEDVKLHRFVALKFLPDEIAKEWSAESRYTHRYRSRWLGRRRLGPRVEGPPHSDGPSYILLPAAVVFNYGLIDKKVPANSLSPLPLPTVTNSSLVAPLDEFPPPKAI